MSFSAFLMKFHQGEPATICWTEVEKFALAYGCLDQGVAGYELTFDDEIIADVVEIIGDPEQGVSGFTLSHPINGPEMRAFVFRAIEQFGMLFFDQDCDQGYARNDISAQLPESLLDDFGGSLTVIDSAESIWQ